MPTANWSVISHGGRIIHDVHINTYIRVSSQPVRHTCSLYYGHSRQYTYMLPSISIYYFHAFYFKRFNSFSLKLLSADGIYVYFYEHISGVWFVIKCRWSTAGSKRISFITEGLPWKVTVNSCSIQKKQQKRRSRCIKKRERRSRAFPSDSNPGCMTTSSVHGSSPYSSKYSVSRTIEGASRMFYSI